MQLPWQCTSAAVWWWVLMIKLMFQLVSVTLSVTPNPNFCPQVYAVLYDPQQACYLQCLDHEHRGSCMGLGALLLHVTCKRTAARLGMHGHWLQRVLCTLCMLHGRQRGPAVAL
jgi:hypothetical protein